MILLFFSSARLYSAPADKAVPVPVEKVRTYTNHRERTYPGRVISVAKVNITSQVNGLIREVKFRNGSMVKKGDLLFLIDQIKYQAAVKNAEAQVAELKAKIIYAKSSYERQRKLAKSQAVSLDTLESALSNYEAQTAALAAAEARLVSAREDLVNCRISAPISGKISTAAFTEGNYVTPNTGSLAILVQVDPVRVRFSMSSRDFLTMFEGRTSRICTEGQVELFLANGKKYALPGKVEYVENEMDGATDTVTVYALFENKNHILIPGGTLHVRLRDKKGTPQPGVPLSAIVQDVKGTFVWVVKNNNIVEKRYIQRDELLDGKLLISSGVNPGEEIVVDGVHKLTPGMRIKPVRKQ